MAPIVTPVERIRFDLIRSISIVLILLTHFTNYIQTQILFSILEYGSSYFAEFGLGGFFFLSGFLLYNTHGYNQVDDILVFYKRRFFRIMPLYWCALFIFIIGNNFIFFNNHSPISVTSMFAHFIGGQLLLSPYVSPLFTLWFIGALIPFYLIYPFLIKNTKDNSSMLIGISVGFFVVFILINKFLGIISDTRFYMYYIIFIAGIFSNMSGIYVNTMYSKYLKLNAVLLVFLIVCPYIFSSKTQIITDILPLIQVSTIMSFSIFVFWISKYLVYFADTINIYVNIRKTILFISFSSYCIYLFHRPMFTLFQAISNSLMLSPWVNDLIILFVITPAVFVISFKIQSEYNDILHSPHIPHF